MSDAREDIWARISSMHLPRKPMDCKTCRSKMKVKRSKSLSPEPSSSRDYKRPKIETEEEAAARESGACTYNVLDFSDDVLLNIMKYLHPQDLLALSLCCRRLDRVCRDRTLWNRMDCRFKPVPMDHLEKYVKFLHPSTTCVAIRGNPDSSPAFRNEFLTTVSDTCKNIKELFIEDCNLNSQDTNIRQFPRTLEKLSLKGCSLRNFDFNSEKSYLWTIDLHMPYLTCLILSNCAWFTSQSLMVLGKIPKLKELRLNSCHRIGECVAYASIATRGGFKSLEILDLRDTAVGDSELSCFSITKTLTHIYLECPKARNRASPSSSFRAEPRSSARNRGHCGRDRMQSLEAEGCIPMYEDRNIIQYMRDFAEASRIWDGSARCLISDRSVCSLGTYICDRRIIGNPIQEVYDEIELLAARGVVFAADVRVCNNPNLRTLVVRNYPLVTNHSLDHLAANASTLELIDVTGTSVTQEGVERFKAARPNVKILSSFNEE